ncbi:IS4 family transposase [Clostridium sporogenes]|uniref:IS4 family transposase n=1 Tax=Clostridium caseinilyticum TaxID=3350403 RepID=UPI0013D51D60|nr:IS4 family transposase [Clostridium sporogenes]UAL60963.1 IS4 family transposase [Clostridium sporogenes]
MKKISRKKTELIKEIFTKQFLESVARRTKFIQREGTLTAKSFVSLCAFYNNSICEASLSKQSTYLVTNEGVSISPQALYERFNKYAVEFLKSILKETLIRQNKILAKNENSIKRLFNRINVVDSTTFKLSDNLKKFYKGTGGHTANAAIKIQLQYDILSGQIFACDIEQAASSDSSYVGEVQKNIQPKDLILKDLGYFNMKDLDFIDKEAAFYISKVKKYTITYIKEEKNTPK